MRDAPQVTVDTSPTAPARLQPQAAAAAPMLTVTGLTKAYGGKRVLHETTLAVRAGEIVAVLGPSGSGKTTLFRCLARLVEPDAGAIHLDGVPLLGLRGHALATARGRIGVVFQQFNLVRRLSAIDNVLAARLAQTPLWRVMLRAFDEDDEARALDALDLGMPRPEVIRTFGVSTATLTRWRRRQRDTGSLAESLRPGPPGPKQAGLQAGLLPYLEEHPDATLEELCTWWEQTRQVRVSHATMSRVITRHFGWTRKKLGWQTRLE